MTDGWMDGWMGKRIIFPTAVITVLYHFFNSEVFLSGNDDVYRLYCEAGLVQW